MHNHVIGISRDVQLDAPLAIVLVEESKSIFVAMERFEMESDNKLDI